MGSITSISGGHAVVRIAVGGAVLAKWVYDMYQASCVPLLLVPIEKTLSLLSHGHLQRLISYIIDLTLVLQTLYLVSDSQELSRRSINLAAASYQSSSMQSVHARVQDYVGQLRVLDRMDPHILDKIIELISLYTIDSEEMSDIRGKISDLDVDMVDEP
jgi:hypothetical protein